jgi:hypothetical protein
VAPADAAEVAAYQHDCHAAAHGAAAQAASQQRASSEAESWGLTGGADPRPYNAKQWLLSL